MRRVWIALAAILGFGIAFVATWLVGLWQSQSAACDGVCVDQFAAIGLLALLLGVLGALAGGFAARSLLSRYFAKPS